MVSKFYSVCFLSLTEKVPQASSDSNNPEEFVTRKTKTSRLNELCNLVDASDVDPCKVGADNKPLVNHCIIAMASLLTAAFLAGQSGE